MPRDTALLLVAETGAVACRENWRAVELFVRDKALDSSWLVSSNIKVIADKKNENEIELEVLEAIEHKSISFDL